MQSKPVVSFSEFGGFVSRFHDGQVGSIYTDKWILTDEVVKKYPDGAFETATTLYTPVEEI